MIICIDGASDCTGCGNCIQNKTIGICEHCSDVIYAGEDYYEIDDILLHEDCLREYAQANWKKGA